MAKSKSKAIVGKPLAGKKVAAKKSINKTAKNKKAATKKTGTNRAVASRSRSMAAVPSTDQAMTGPVTLAEAKSLVHSQWQQPQSGRRATQSERTATLASVAEQRHQIEDQVQTEFSRRIREFKATMSVMQSRGVKGLSTSDIRENVAPTAAAAQPLQVFAQGDSWFDYPVPFFGGGIIPRLENRLGIPILNLAKAGDEVRNMLGVEERKLLSDQLKNGSPAGGRWDVLLFSGGGNDIVGNPMALWIQDYNAAVPPPNLISKVRFDAALELVQAGYEDLIQLRDTLSPTTHLIFHGYDFAIPDGRGICGMGPWMKPTFDLRGFPPLSPAPAPSPAVVKSMLQQFAANLQSLAAAHNDVTFINTQGTLAPVASSWHNELHPSSDGFDEFAAIFQAKLKALFPARVPS